MLFLLDNRITLLVLCIVGLIIFFNIHVVAETNRTVKEIALSEAAGEIQVLRSDIDNVLDPIDYEIVDWIDQELSPGTQQPVLHLGAEEAFVGNPKPSTVTPDPYGEGNTVEEFINTQPPQYVAQTDAADVPPTPAPTPTKPAPTTKVPTKPPTPAPARASPPTKENLNLIISIPSVQRPSGVSYLPQTVESWCREGAQEPTIQFYILIHLLDNDVSFDIMDGCLGLPNVNVIVSRIPEIPDDISKSESAATDLLGKTSTAQTTVHNQHVIFILRQIQAFADKKSIPRTASSVFALMEDDFEVCPGGLNSIAQGIRAAPPDFSILYSSAGLNGIFVHLSDAAELENYYLGRLRGDIKWRNKKSNRPVDHIICEWSLKETTVASRYLQSRHNYIMYTHVFKHVGLHSSEGHMWDYQDGEPLQWFCGAPMTEPHFFRGIAFDPACTGSVISPCSKLPNPEAAAVVP
eukprot:Rmarinus@m.9676